MINEALGKAILQSFEEKTSGRKLVCGICGGTRWQVSGIVNLPAQENINQGLVIGGSAFPLALLTCGICGNTQLLNILVLLGKDKLEQLAREGKVDQMLEEAHESLEE